MPTSERTERRRGRQVEMGIVWCEERRGTACTVRLRSSHGIIHEELKEP